MQMGFSDALTVHNYPIRKCFGSSYPEAVDAKDCKYGRLHGLTTASKWMIILTNSPQMGGGNGHVSPFKF